MSDERLTNLLLATAPFLKSARGPVGIRFRAAWLASSRQGERAAGCTQDAALDVFKTAVTVCAAAGIKKIDLIECFNGYCDEGGQTPAMPLALDELLSSVAGVTMTGAAR